MRDVKASRRGLSLEFSWRDWGNPQKSQPRTEYLLNTYPRSYFCTNLLCLNVVLLFLVNNTITIAGVQVSRVSVSHRNCLVSNGIIMDSEGRWRKRSRNASVHYIAWLREILEILRLENKYHNRTTVK
jgi:hypothetical protein